MKFQDGTRTNPVGIDELLDAGIPHAHQGKFGSGKEGIGCDQEQNEENPEQHKSYHGWVILTF